VVFQVSKQVLVVDDDPVIRNLFAALLRRRGMVALQAADGLEAISLLKTCTDGHEEGDFDLVILDLMMPRASGWDVINFLQKERPELVAHLIVVSAAGADAAAELRRRGCGVYINKPFETEELYAAVDRCIRETGPGGGGGPGTTSSSMSATGWGF
jgi:CheY-like chemotaxis protein